MKKKQMDFNIEIRIKSENVEYTLKEINAELTCFRKNYKIKDFIIYRFDKEKQ